MIKQGRPAYTNPQTHKHTYFRSLEHANDACLKFLSYFNM